MKDFLKSLLEKVPDTYPDFVRGVCLEVVDDSAVLDLISFVQANPTATSSEIAERVDIIKGRKTLI